MELRYQLALVTGAGGAVGREIAVALARAGAAVLAADPDLAGAEETARLCGVARVKAWAWQADLTDEAELITLAARARDVGGADLLVSVADGAVSESLTRLFIEDLDSRRGRRGGTPGVVTIAADATAGTIAADPATAARCRVMTVVTGGTDDDTPTAKGSSTAVVARAVLDLLAHGHAGQVVELPNGPRAT